MLDQPLASTPTTNPVVPKSKGYSYTKSGIDKCYRCGEPGYKSNECSKRRQINMADYEDENEVQIETEPKDSDFTEEYEDPAACVV